MIACRGTLPYIYKKERVNIWINWTNWSIHEIDIFYNLTSLFCLSILINVLQQVIMCIGSTLVVPFILSGLICIGDKVEVTSALISITMFMCGVATIIQTLFGIRYWSCFIFCSFCFVLNNYKSLEYIYRNLLTIIHK